MAIDVKTYFIQLVESKKKEDLKPYLVIDATWQVELAQTIRENQTGWEPLMGVRGENKEEIHVRSPLIVDLTVLPKIIDPWFVDGFPSKLGFVLFSREKIETIRFSLKRFATVIIPNTDSPVYFRFYDARTLYCFLMTGCMEQWKDFFRDIDCIAAPSDKTKGWTLYRLAEDALRIALEKPDGGGFQWHMLKNSPEIDDEYRSTFPKRRLREKQYAAMIECANKGFYNEICEFLEKSFPKRNPIYSGNMISFIKKFCDTAINENYATETCQYYWSVLSFIGGELFYKDQYINLYFQIEYLSKEQKLANILYAYNTKLNNKYVERLLNGEYI